MSLPPWASKLPLLMITDAAAKHSINVKLLIALVQTESSGNPAATRVEKDWKYFVDVANNAERLGIPVATEIDGQRTSWGYCQIMGSVARELGYSGQLFVLGTNPQLALDLGARKLSNCLILWPLWDDALAGYNGGSPRKDKYGNLQQSLQVYVDKVNGYLNQLKGDTPCA